MSSPQYVRETARVKEVHPGLDDATARRIAESYVQKAAELGTSLEDLLAQSLRAESSSAVGNDTVTV